MLATVMHGPGDVRYEQVEDPKIVKPTDAIIRLAATTVAALPQRRGEATRAGVGAASSQSDRVSAILTDQPRTLARRVSRVCAGILSPRTAADERCVTGWPPSR